MISGTDAQQPHVPTTDEQSPVDRVMRGVVFNLLLVVASGVLASFMFPPREVWWYGWLYLVPLFVALRRTSAIRASAWLMLLFGIVFLGCTLTWLSAIFRISVIGIFALASLPWLLFALAYRVAGERYPGLPVVLLAPVLWVAVEWIRCEGWYFEFSWAQFGFAFTSCRSGGELYPYIGVYGATFLVILVNALLAETLLSPARWGKRLAVVVVTAAVMVPFSYYLNRPVPYTFDPQDEKQAFRTLVVQDESGDLDSLRAYTLSHAGIRPQVIVWPEYSVLYYPLEDMQILDTLQALARETRSTLIVGCKEHAPDNARVDWLRRRAMMLMEGQLVYNTALVIGPDGRIIGTYHKTHPIQFFSDGVPGRAFPTFNTEVGRIGIGICYDFDYAMTAVKLVRNGAQVLIVPTYDAQDWSETQHLQHARMAQARAAEAGRWVLRATSSGVSQIIQPTGRMDAAIPSGDISHAFGFASPRNTLTPYMRGGYLLPKFCLGISILWLLWTIAPAVMQRNKRKQTREV